MPVKFPFGIQSQNSNRQFAVIGLGRFGRSVCRTLHHAGYEVVGTDINQKLVDAAVTERIVSHAIQLDSTDPNALREVGILEFDTVIVAIGNYMEESIVTTLNAKEGGVSFVVAKASSDIHGKLLHKVGADQVVFPEHEAGASLAHALTRPTVLERLDLDPEHSIVEMMIPEIFHNCTIAELQLRNRYGLNLLAIGNEGKFEINPPPERRLSKGLAMVVIGSQENIQKLLP